MTTTHSLSRPRTEAAVCACCPHAESPRAALFPALCPEAAPQAGGAGGAGGGERRTGVFLDFKDRDDPVLGERGSSEG